MYLGWEVTFEHNGAVAQTKALKVDILLEGEEMTRFHHLKSTVSLDAQCYTPSEDDDYCLEMTDIYQSRVGHIRYLLNSTRPDIA